jgi:hypothetical protein
VDRQSTKLRKGTQEEMTEERIKVTPAKFEINAPPEKHCPWAEY